MINTSLVQYFRGKTVNWIPPWYMSNAGRPSSVLNFELRLYASIWPNLICIYFWAKVDKIRDILLLSTMPYTSYKKNTHHRKKKFQNIPISYRPSWIIHGNIWYITQAIPLWLKELLHIRRWFRFPQSLQNLRSGVSSKYHIWVF